MKPCFEGWTKELGNSQGTCCCNCIYQAMIVTRNSKDDEYGCACFFTLHQTFKVEGIQKEGEVGKISRMSDPHGMCEMWEDRDDSTPKRQP